MREDPIIFEDWKIAPFDEKTLRLVSRVDVSLSFLMALLGMVLGVILKEEYLFLIWLFYFFLSIFVDLLILQTKFSLLNKLLSFSILLGIIYLSLNNSETYATSESVLITTQIISLILSVLVTLKFIFLLVSDTTWAQVGETLAPKTPRTSLKLQNHYSMLQNTDFKINDAKEIRKNVYGSFIYIIMYSVQAIILALILIGSKKIGFYLIIESYDNYLNIIGILLIWLSLVMLFILWVIPVLLISEFIRIYLFEKKAAHALFLKIKKIIKRQNKPQPSLNTGAPEYVYAPKQEVRNPDNMGVNQ